MSWYVHLLGLVTVGGVRRGVGFEGLGGGRTQERGSEKR